MSTRKRPSAADYLADLEKSDSWKPAEKRQDKELPESTAIETGTQMMAFRIPRSIANELRGASWALDVDQAAILRQSLERELIRIRRKYNEGEPFPGVTTEKGKRSRRL